jgi:hypothetical protein
VPAAAVCGLVALKRGQKNTGVGVLVLSAIGFLGILYLSQQITTIAADPFAPNVLSGATPPIVTLDEYQRLEDGISYREAVEIIGTDGDEVSRSDVAGYRTVMYSWSNSGGSNMNAMFQNDKLVNKAQFGLR